MTYNDSEPNVQESDAISFGGCPYVYYSNIVNRRYIALPRNISDLNDVFCAPVNRRGLLCRDCIDGFGPSVVTTDYACANCTEIHSCGWMLYILSELVPATVFYFAILILRIRITSAPMNCFVMFSQLLINVLNHSPWFMSSLMASLDVTSRAFLKVILTGYGFWNLDFFRYLIPPFCVSRGLKNIHVLTLQYVSAFYPLLLIALTYACVELHGHNFRPFVWLWKPFHRCCVKVRRSWNTKASIIDVFATFLVLSYSKLLFVSAFLLKGTEIYNADGELVSGTPYVLRADATVKFLGEEHLPFAIIAYCVISFTLIPPLLLIFYPCNIFKKCLNRCSARRWHALHIFVEAFQGCYKDGVTGGWDLRSMSGVYLLFRFLLLIANCNIGNKIGWLLRALMFLSLSILVLIVQPYKKTYMNVADGLLLALLGFLTLVLVIFQYFHIAVGYATLPLILATTCSLPQLVLLLSVTYRQLKGKQVVQYITRQVRTFIKRVCKRNRAENELSEANPLPHRLIDPNQYNNRPVGTYGSIN